jgi:MoaA/NifB/PqqE/SkfB family radical SAM enzyme
VQLYLAPDGDVRVCCRNWQAVGNVAEASLLTIWRGAAHRDVVRRLAGHDYSAGCEQCHGETVLEGRATAYPSLFDSFTDAVEEVGDEAGLPWPSRIEFNLSNACNLMCIQCDGLLSSAIRAHRDHLPPLPRVYDDAFFSDLARFIPHLTEAQFAGGEPFFAGETFRVWNLIAELNPTLPCIVVTNATQWSRRIDAITSTVRMGFTFSIDGATAQTYESIRINSDFDVVMANIERYAEKARRAEMPLEVNFCLMRQNVHEFGEMMLWIESKGFKANVSVVRNPPQCSLATLDAGELASVVDALERSSDRVRSQLGPLNQPIWDNELRRLRWWATASDQDRDGLWWASLPSQPVRIATGVVAKGPVQVDTSAAEAWVARVGPGAIVHSILIDEPEGGDEGGGRVAECSPGVPELLGLDPSAVAGAEPGDLLLRIQGRLGPLLDVGEERVDDDRTDTELHFERGTVRASTLPRRGRDGVSTGARVLIGVHERPPSEDRPAHPAA